MLSVSTHIPLKFTAISLTGEPLPQTKMFNTIMYCPLLHMPTHHISKFIVVSLISEPSLKIKSSKLIYIFSFVTCTNLLHSIKFIAVSLNIDRTTS